MSLRSDLRRLVKQAKRQGFEVAPTRSGHIRVMGEDGQRVIMSSTPSDHRAFLNARARLRKLGVKV